MQSCGGIVCLDYFTYSIGQNFKNILNTDSEKDWLKNTSQYLKSILNKDSEKDFIDEHKSILKSILNKDSERDWSKKEFSVRNRPVGILLFSCCAGSLAVNVKTLD